MSRLHIVWAGGLAAVLFSLTAAAETPREHSDCVDRCITEHNCCIKSCNWVKPRDKSECLERCESILQTCQQECDGKAAEYLDANPESP